VERLLNRLERRYGRYALGNITYYLVGLQCLGFVLSVARPDFLERLYLDVDAIRAGEFWRLFTWLAVPISTSPFWVLFSLYWLYLMGTSLEAQWGAFKYQLYWLVGIVFTAGIACVTHAPVDNSALIMSLFLAFATLWPDYTIMVLFVLPVRVKWLALLDGAFILYQVGTLPGWAKFLPLVAIANYLLFFGESLVGMMRRGARQAGRAREYQRWKRAADEGRRAVRRCAICSVTDENPSIEFRVCSCERCGGVLRDLCLEHARNH
jgi:hypothetical protein